MKPPSSRSFALNVEVEDFCLTLVYVRGVLIVGISRYIESDVTRNCLHPFAI